MCQACFLFKTLKVKGGKTGDPKKLSQAEEDYNQAKNAYLQLHSDLYEELPALYDSRISFYVSSFQSIFTAEGVFHRETAKNKTEMNDLLDVLAKETSAGAYSTRRPLSVISNASSDGDSAPENCAKFEQTDGKVEKCDHTDENSENETSENEEVEASAVAVKLPVEETLETQASCNDDETDKPPSDNTPTVSEQKSDDIPPPRPPKPPVDRPPSPNTAEVVDTQALAEHEEEEKDSADAGKDNTPEVKVEASNDKDKSEKDESEKDESEKDKSEKNGSEKDGREKDDREEENGVEERDSDIDLSRVLYKVEATHPYNGEDEDELTFEKGDIIQVIPYNQSDDPDDGWLLGVLEGSGVRGVFPQNFTRKLEEQ